MEERELDSLFVALADPRRRRVCAYLARADELVATLEELAAAVESEERPEPTPRATGTSSVANVRAGLHHVHLPKLDDATVVEYASGEKSVRTDAAFPVALELLRTVGALESVPEWDADSDISR